MVLIETGCGEEGLGGIESYIASPVVCTGQQEKLITTPGKKFLGAREEVLGGLSSPADISHGVDAEVIDISGNTSTHEVFAVAWAGGANEDHKIFIRRYSSDPAIKDFLSTPQVLYDAPSSGWVRRMGFDNMCGAINTFVVGNCGWFVWEAGTAQSPAIKYAAINVHGFMSPIKTLDEEGWQPSGERGQKLFQHP